MTSLNTKILKSLFHNGVIYLSNNFEYIDQLNVFPVPDGDTGTNLKITTSGAWESIADLETEDLSLLTKAFARGLLMNARGNSGVIFSQIFKGFSSAFSQGQKEASLSDLTKAFVNAKEYAYKSVATPVEGTILTVARVTSEKLIEATGKFQSIEEFFEFAYKEAKIILDKTPDFLIQLKEVGVVDSGGYGLTVFIEGMKEALLHPNAKIENTAPATNEANKNAINKNFVDDNEGFGYCTEFIMKIGSRVTVEQEEKSRFDETYFKKRIGEMGDCFVYVKDDDIVKVHIHLIEPYKLLEFASKYGEFTKIKIENMTLQFMMRNKGTSLESLEQSYRADNEITNNHKVVATVPSQALKDIYAKEFGIKNCLNCDEIGNPTIQQFYDLIKSAKSKKVIIVTDNGNILMAADQAAKLFPKKNYSISIIPAKDIATSYLTCLSFNPELEDDTVKEMERAFKNCESCKISKSVKNIRYKDLNIKYGDYIGVRNKEIITNAHAVSFVTNKMIDEIFGDVRRPKSAVIIYGKDATMEEVNRMYRYIYERYLVKPIMIQGNQSTYHYYIGVTK